jgi:hypothetical protein
MKRASGLPIMASTVVPNRAAAAGLAMTMV